MPAALILLLFTFFYTPAANAQPVINSTQTDQLDTTTDDGDGVAESGENVDYSIDVTNSGDADAAGVNLQLGPDPNQTVDPASISSTPVGIDDSFNSPVNTQLVVDAPGVLDNDINVDGDVLSVSDTGARTTTELGTATVNADGSFTYDPPGDFTGDDTFTYIVQDDVDGQDASTPNTTTVTITVSANQAPSFTSGPDPVEVDEDSGAYSEIWATNISPGAGEDSQTVTFNITNNTNAALFTVAPSIAEDGTLTFTPADDAEGSADITVELQDDGGTAGGGDDTSDPVTFTITVNGINDEPSFTIAGDPAAVDEDAGAQTVNGFASAISAGPPEESGQTLTFNITNNTNAALFSAGPAVSATTGNLTYTPSLNANGSAIITIELQDDGGTANGGDDTSPSQNFTITVNPVNDPPSVSGTSAFTATGNIQIASNLFAGLTVTDVDGTGTPPLPFTILETNITTTQNGQVVVTSSSGSFTYEPPVGFTGANDTFTFNICDNGIPGTACTPVNATVMVNGIVWFIDSSGTGTSPGTGTFNNPFKTIAAFNSSAGPSTGQFISLASGTYTESDGINLQNNQTLIGEGVQFSSFFTADSNSIAAYQTFAGAAGTSPQIVTNAGNNDGVDLGSGNTVRGLNIGNTTGYAFDGGAVGTLTISNVNVTGNGGAIRVSTSGTFGSTVNFGELSSANSFENGISLAGVTGTLGIASGNISQPTGNAVLVSGGSVGFTYPGTITKTASLGSNGIFVQNHSGTLNFNGNSTLGNTGSRLTANAVNLATNTGIYNFAGVDLATNNALGFNATGGGTVNITSTTNTVNTTNATAVNINGTTIGVSGITLQSVNASNGPSGIVLNGTGTTGFFTVTGDGSVTAGVLDRDGSGGTIQNTTDDGVQLTNANNVTLRQMNLLNVGDTANSLDQNNRAANDHGIDSVGGGNIILSAVHINAPAASGWECENITGVNRIDNDSLIEDINVSNFQALEVRNTNTNLTSFTLNDSTFRDQATTNGSTYVLFQSFGTSNMTINVQNGSTFTNLFGFGLQINAGAAAGDNGTVNANISNSVFSDAVDGTAGVGASGGIGGLVLAASQNARINFDVDNNTFFELGRPLVAGGVITIQGIGGTGKTIDGIFQNNDIDRIGFQRTVDTTSSVGHRVIDVVTENNIGFLDVEIVNNDIDETSNTAIFVSSRGSSQDFDVRIENNRLGTVTPIGSTGERDALTILSEDTSNMQALVNNNMIAGNTSNLSQVVDIDVENTSTMNMTFTNNTVTNASGGTVDDPIVIDTEGGQTSPAGLCLDFTGNTANSVELDVNGSFRVEDFANLSTNNNGITIVDGAGVTNVASGTCTEPNF